MKYVNFLVITETKLDDTFWTFQFLVDDFYKPFKLDRNKKDGGTKKRWWFSIDVKVTELSFKKCKLLQLCTYHPLSKEH